MKKYRAGLVGCGRIGSEFDKDPKRKTVSTHAGAYASLANIEFCAVSDADPEKMNAAKERWSVPRAYPDYRDMLAREKLDLLSVCTWNNTHREIIEEAVRHGVRGVYCEKPIAESVESAEAIDALCEKSGLVFQINHQRRFDRRHRELRERILRGELGRMQSAVFHYTAGVANTGSHMFDLLRFFLGDAVWAEGVFSPNVSPNPNDPNVDGCILFENGVFCSVHACDVKEFLIFELDLIGTRGRVRVMKSGFRFETSEVKDSDVFTGYKELFRADETSEAGPQDSWIVEGVKHLVSCLDEGRPSISSADDGKKALELICAMKESAENGGKRMNLPLLKSGVKIQSK